MNSHNLDYLEFEISNHYKIKLNFTEKIKASYNIEHLQNQIKHFPLASNSQKNLW